MLAAALIDLDGTMVDTHLDFLISIRRLLGDFCLSTSGVNADFVRTLIGKGTENLLSRVFERTLGFQHGSPQLAKQVEVSMPIYLRHYAALNGEHAHVYPGVKECLFKLTQMGIPMACVTNKPTGLAKALLHKMQLDAHFQLICGGDAFDQRKPHPLPLLRACDALLAAPAQTIMVGDSMNDAQAAAAAGCPVVLVTYGYNHGQPILREPAIAHVDNLGGVDWEGISARLGQQGVRG
jgi:phosphoglycolate phosphatase